MECNYRFNNNYSRQLLDSLNDLRNESHFCDIIINVGGKSFPAHKNVLGASSPYFLKMFTSGFKESTENEIRIDGEPDIFEILLNYAYTGTLKVTSHTAYDVLEMACYMGFLGAVQVFYAFLRSKIHKLPTYRPADGTKSSNKSKSPTSTKADDISVEDIYKILHLARLANDGGEYFGKIIEDAEKYLCQHVKELKTAGAFLQLATEDFFKSFLKRPTFPVEEGSELQILEMVVNWLKHDWGNRCVHAPDVLQLVRLGLVPIRTVIDVVGVDIFGYRNSRDLFSELLVDSKEMSSDTVVDLTKKPSHNHASRSTIMAPIAFFESNIEDDHPDKKEVCEIYQKWYMHYFDIDANKWKFLSRFKMLPEWVSLIVVEGKLYSAGGCNNEKAGYRYHNANPISSKKFFCYNAEFNKWHILPPMKKPRQNFPMVSLDGYIYAIGGYDQDKNLLRGDVERFSIAGNEWENLPSLPEGFVWVSVIKYHEKILAYGVSGSAKVAKPKATASADSSKAATSEDSSKAAASEVSSEEKIPERTRKHVLQMYDPSTKTWQCKYENNHITNLIDGVYGILVASEALLFLYQDSCYRVLYTLYADQGFEEPDVAGKRPKSNKKTDHDTLWLDAYSVDKLKLIEKDDNVEVIVGESFSQDRWPGSILGPFCIQDDVFITIKGSVFKTDLKMSAGQTTNVDFSWHDLTTAKLNEHSNVVFFSFDQQKLGYYKR